MTMEINERFKWLCWTLEKDSLNYAVNFHVYCCPGAAGKSLSDIVTGALEHSVIIGGSGSATPDAVVQSLKDGLEYKGDHGSHPNLSFLLSDQFAAIKTEIVGYFEQLSASANQILSFWLKKGHPFYPVFWDFAYLIEKGSDAYVFIGSSSD